LYSFCLASSPTPFSDIGALSGQARTSVEAAFAGWLLRKPVNKSRPSCPVTGGRESKRYPTPTRMTQSHGRRELPRSRCGSTPIVITNEPSSEPDVVKPRPCSGDAAHRVVVGRKPFGYSKALRLELDLSFAKIRPAWRFHRRTTEQGTRRTARRDTFSDSVLCSAAGEWRQWQPPYSRSLSEFGIAHMTSRCLRFFLFACESNCSGIEQDGHG